MKRLILCAALALSLPGCTTSGLLSAGATVADASGVPKPNPLANTAADEKALTLAAKTVDLAAVTITALVAAGAIEPGSLRAKAIAQGLDRARLAVNAAAAARDAANEASYTAALADADAAIAFIRAAIGSN